MTLLRDIQESATSSDVRLADTLRRCKILAARLQNTTFARWVDLELNGYPKDEPIPTYRVFENVHSAGNFVSLTLQAEFPIPNSALPKELRDRFANIKCRQSVAFYESLSTAPGSVLQAPWPPDLVAHMQERFVEAWSCVRAWQVIPPGSVVALLDAVRNRVLAFALEIEAQAPGAGEAPTGSGPPVPPERVNQIYFNIFGGTQTIGAGTDFTMATSTQIIQGDTASLGRYLAEELGVGAADVKALEVAIQADPAPIEKSVGARVKEWIGGMAAKGASGVWEVGKSVGTQVLIKAIEKYYGIG
jgi:hypothetical protein